MFAAIKKASVLVAMSGILVAGPAIAQQSPDFRDMLVDGVRASELSKLIKAEEAYRQALSLRQQEVGASDPSALDIQLSLALNLSRQGKFREAELVFEAARQALLTQNEPSVNARFYVFRAIDEANRGDLDAAAVNARGGIRVLRQALKAQKSGAQSGLVKGFGASLLELAHALAVEASIALKRNDIPLARQDEELARKIVVDTPDTPKWWLSQLDDLRAKIDIADNKLDDAEKRLRSSLIIKRQVFGETRPAADAFMNLGDVLHRQNKVDEAVTALQRGVDIVEDGLKDGQSLTAERVSGFLDAAWARLQIEQEDATALKAEMFGATQLVRQGSTARTLDRVVARLGAGDAAIADQVRATQEATRLRDIARLELGAEAAKRRSDRDPARMEQLRIDYERLQQAADAASTALREVFPQYDQVVESQTVALTDLQNSLGQGEAFVSFLAGPKNGYSFLVTAGDLVIHRFDKGQGEIDGYVSVLKRSFDVTDGSLSEYDINASAELYQTLFGSFDPVAAGVTHMVVSPTGSLLSLPFGILARAPVAGPPGKDAYLRAQWLAKDVATSVAPSIKSFVALRQAVQGSRASKTLIGFGNPVFEGKAAHDRAAATGHADLDECNPNGILPSHLVRGLAPLPDTQDELLTIGNLVGRDNAELYFDNAVTQPAVTAKNLADYRIVYFATHGLLPQEIECQSEPALALTAPLQTTSKLDDGLLGASEIAELELDADLVVLSACNTGGGDGQFGGDSLSGLARSFFFAGARSLLVSHWQVSSRDTVSLMTGLFGKSNMGLSEAMRQAQLDMINNPETAHPFFWGPFTLVGDGRKAMAF